MQLSTESYAALANQNTLGGEFAATAANVPEPGTLALIGLALLSLFGFGTMRRRTDA